MATCLALGSAADPSLLRAEATAARVAEADVDYLITRGAPGRPGGRLVVALRAEPKTFNPVTAIDNPSLTVIRRLTGDLIHVDRSSQNPVPALAESWQRSADGLEYEVRLRRGIRFSDGEPFGAEDVVFSFQVLLDPKIGSPHRQFLMPGGRPIQVEKLGSHRLRFRLAAPNAAGERLFDNLPILPRHRLKAAYEEGRLADAWGLETDPEEVVGLGAFQLQAYSPGERLVLRRNPHYWKVDAAGAPLPYLESLVFVFVPDQMASALRFQSGETHLVDRLSTESFEFLRRRGGLDMRDLGPGLEYSFLFFNLNQLENQPELEKKQTWFKDLRFRRAISSTIDRDGIAGLIYGGRAAPLLTQVTPGIRNWVRSDLEPKRRSTAEARKLLREAGFEWRDDKLFDAQGLPVELTILTSASNEERMGMATIVQEDLRQLGIAADVVGLEFRALLERVLKTHDYDAVILSMDSGDTDPNALIPVLTSTGGTHLWQLKAGSVLPSWQQELDELMSRQAVTLDAKERFALYGRAQQLMAEYQPMIFLVSPHVLVGGASNLGNFEPTVLGHSTLWNVDQIYWRVDAERP